MAYQNGIVPILRGYGVIEPILVPYESSATLIGTGRLTAYGTDNDLVFAHLIGNGRLESDGVLTDPRSAYLVGIGAIVVNAKNDINIGPFSMTGIGNLLATAGQEILAYSVMRGSGRLSVDIEYYKEPAEYVYCYDVHIDRITEDSYCNVNKCFPGSASVPVETCDAAACDNGNPTVVIIDDPHSYASGVEFGNCVSITCDSVFVQSYEAYYYGSSGGHAPDGSTNGALDEFNFDGSIVEVDIPIEPQDALKPPYPPGEEFNTLPPDEMKYWYLNGDGYAVANLYSNELR